MPISSLVGSLVYIYIFVFVGVCVYIYIYKFLFSRTVRYPVTLP